ncbi:hypothetical protein AVEN_78093-1 [Araneus ventricosus]|uniref:Uncharacterized protein n=1 Tax=Araneus ventricosus TaxID=182803 RepID=A0A4Y2F5C5_ARAVE|nr:hypothetical protein AVEN_78093-1 [Araneus ventricosus]
MSPNTPQTAPCDRGPTQAVSGASVNFTREKWFLSLLTSDCRNLGVVLLEFLYRKEGFHSVFVNEDILQFLSSTEKGHPSLLLNWEFPKRFCVPSVSRYGVKRSSLCKFAFVEFSDRPGGYFGEADFSSCSGIFKPRNLKEE